ncbi:MAG TPA: hypothetical protein V6D11_25730 [Waterburya sp.]|jgi:hypothetical protein
MQRPCKYTFANKLTAEAIDVHSFVELSEALPKIGLHRTYPTLVLVGGASGIGEADINRLQRLFVEEIAPLAQELGVAVVDGGTDAGIMQFIGQARTQIRGTFPLIGVAAMGTVILPNVSPPNAEAAPLEPNHTHFVLVPGSNWGDESPWLSRLASVLSDGFPSVTVVVNGGEITFQDVSNSVLEDRPVLTLEGTGRTADKLAAALRGEATDWRAKQLAASGKMHAIDLIEHPTRLTQVIRGILSKLLPI